MYDWLLNDALEFKKNFVSDQPYVIGLTGGMASGKSAIRDDLEKLGAATIDCDKLGISSFKNNIQRLVVTPKWSSVFLKKDTKAMKKEDRLTTR